MSPQARGIVVDFVARTKRAEPPSPPADEDLYRVAAVALEGQVVIYVDEQAWEATPDSAVEFARMLLRAAGQARGMPSRS